MVSKSEMMFFHQFLQEIEQRLKVAFLLCTLYTDRLLAYQSNRVKISYKCFQEQSKEIWELSQLN